MDNIVSLISEIKSGVVLVSFYQGQEKIASGSAFLCKNKIISNNHVFHPPEGNFQSDTAVVLKTNDSEFRFEYSKLSEYVISGSAENYFDYITLDIRSDEFSKSKFNFELGAHDDVEVGQKILIMGYPFEHGNLTSHVGHVSAKYLKDDVNVIQLDASVNNGNSGGPVVDLNTKKVVGIVTRKATGLVKQFDDLIKSFDTNVEVLKKITGLSFGTLTLGDLLSISQNQMKVIAINIKRSANVGIGYAFSCDKLQEEDFYKN